MSPADVEALEKLESELSASPTGVSPAHLARIPWLVRLVREQLARVLELEAGGIPEVIAAKDALIAERDAAMAKTAERIAKLEREKLPNPAEYFRSIEPFEKVKVDAVSTSEKLATPSNSPNTEHAK